MANSSLPFKTAELIAIIIIIVLITANLEVLMAAMAIPIGNNTGNNRSSSNVSKMNTTTTTIAGKCNPSLWDFIANPPGRFKIINQCVTVTGTVLSVQREPDGDTDFPLSLDPPYKHMVNQANFNPLMRGGIWSEMICQHPEQTPAVEPFKRGECNGFNGPIFSVPQPGQHLMVTGTYLLDIREGRHAEIHPVSSIKASSS
jgi:hypothetical protein